MEIRQISELEFNLIISSWWRNEDYSKLKLLKKLEKLYKSSSQKISRGDLIQRVRDLDTIKTKGSI